MKKINFAVIGLLLLTILFVSACTQNVPAVSGNNPAGNIPANTGTPPPADVGAAPPSVTPPSNPAPAVGTVKELKIEAYKFGFRIMNDVQINKGDTVRLSVTSTDGIHGFAMPDFNVDISPIGLGETKTAEFVADKSGTFTYFCNVPCGPGHSSMRGALIVN